MYIFVIIPARNAFYDLHAVGITVCCCCCAGVFDIVHVCAITLSIDIIARYYRTRSDRVISYASTGFHKEIRQNPRSVSYAASERIMF